MKKFTFPSIPGFGRQKLAVGLDIGSYAVKICELTETGKNCHKLLKLGSAILPEGAMADGILQDPNAVSQVIAKLLNNLQIKNKKVAISMSGYSVIVKKINLAVMSDKDLANHIQTEAEQYIPFDIDDVYLDFQDLKTNKDSDRTDIMLVAAKKEVVDGYLSMLEGLGLQPVLVDVDAFALENSFAYSGGGMDENVALVDIGATKMSINILAHGTSILARDVVMGSQQITEQIAKQCGYNLEDAEAVKTGRQDPGDQTACLEEVFAKNCTQWILEIKKALDFYLASHADEGIDRLVLSGGASKIKGFDQFLQEETGIKTEIFDPFATATANPDKIDPAYVKHIAPEMAIAVGLAIRTVEL
ncbi:MAG: type IV pilus assembly protein PilM [Desulfobulbaceae bacterium]|nr:type IV pilus assembly protein PilM [Desulfobulbaceae bacterium]